MRGDAPPIEAIEAWPGLEYRKTGTYEWHSDTCPQCGTSGRRNGDRFVVRTDGTDAWTGKARTRGWCRRCKFFAWADAPHEQISDAEKALYRAQAERERTIRAEERQRRVQEFSTAELWHELHSRMGAEQYAWWESQGIAPEYAEFWQLGYTATRTFAHEGAAFTGAAYVIPIFDAGQSSSDSNTWKAINCQYRIVDPPEGVGKYRQEPSLPAAAFVARPDWDICGSGRVLVVEGGKKAMVAYERVEHGTMQCIGLPGARSWAGVPERVACAERVYVALDPDDTGRLAARDLAQRIGKAARIVTLPQKIDDCFVLYGMTARTFARYLDYAERER